MKVGDIIKLKSECYEHTRRINIRNNCGYWEFDPKDNTKCIFEFVILEKLDDNKYKIECNELECKLYGIEMSSDLPSHLDVCIMILKDTDNSVLLQSEDCEVEWWPLKSLYYKDEDMERVRNLIVFAKLKMPMWSRSFILMLIHFILLG